VACIILILAIVNQTKQNGVNNVFKLPQVSTQKDSVQQNNKVVYEESVVTDVVAKSIPSVVTIAITNTSSSDNSQNSFDPYGIFNEQPQEDTSKPQNIGSGFIISKDGLIITNKHVVRDTNSTYTVYTNDKKDYNVEKIYRDPLNDLAILKINANNLKPLPLGNANALKLGQLAIAIGTPLGEFQNTVTVGVISGLGRGITAGSPYEGFVEKLDNVIQTDAAISPGNSGGPLLNSEGQVVGINTAIASEGQNIGFAIPISLVKQLLDTFEKQGSTFERPYIGVRYEMIDKRTAILNDVVEGAYVVSVISGSPAATAGIKEDDIITEIDGKKLSGGNDQDLAQIILNKKVGDTVKVKVYRQGETIDFNMKLEGTSN